MLSSDLCINLSKVKEHAKSSTGTKYSFFASDDKFIIKYDKTRLYTTPDNFTNFDWVIVWRVAL